MPPLPPYYPSHTPTDPSFPSLQALFQARPDLPRRALSVRQPWSSLIVDGRKDIENRSWSTNYRGPVLIHAASRFADIDDEAETRIAAALGAPFEFERPEWMLGGIIGVAEIVACVMPGCVMPGNQVSPWHFPECFGFVLRNARPLPYTPCRGALGFFVPRD